MTPALTFFTGLAIVVLFGWYFATESDRLRRILGTVLTIAVTALCLWSTYPPFDQKGSDGKIIRRGKIHLGLDLQGGTSFLIRLEPPATADGEKRPITKSMVDQAIEAIRIWCRLHLGEVNNDSRHVVSRRARLTSEPQRLNDVER